MLMAIVFLVADLYSSETKFIRSKQLKVYKSLCLRRFLAN